MKKDTILNPVQISFFGPETIVPGANQFAYLIDKFWHTVAVSLSRVTQF